jgi:hypothetical protein
MNLIIQRKLMGSQGLTFHAPLKTDISNIIGKIMCKALKFMLRM